MSRDEIAQAMQDSAGNSWGDEAHFQRFAALVIAAENEACAKVADEWQLGVDDPRYQKSCADAIRARGNT